MFLFINTSNSKFISLALIDKKGKILNYKKIKAEYKQSEKLLSEIEKIFVGADHDLPELKGVIAVLGPGGFTSLRIGIATANALTWALQIPIVGVESKKNVIPNPPLAGRDPMKLQDAKLITIGLNKIKKIKKFNQVLPKYGREPNITIKK